MNMYKICIKSYINKQALLLKNFLKTIIIYMSNLKKIFINKKNLVNLYGL